MPYGFTYLLPVGISFFTFQSLSYTIDFYLGNVPRERNFLRFATFVCFFPQLMAGPIERARHLLPQYQTFPEIRLQNFTDGASLFLVGLFKKLALANYLSLLRRAGLRQSGRLRRPGAARWRPSPSPGRSIAISAATPTWPAAWPRSWAST